MRKKKKKIYKKTVKKICKHISLKCGFQNTLYYTMYVYIFWVLFSCWDLSLWTFFFLLIFRCFIFRDEYANAARVSHWLLYTRAYVIITFYDYYLTQTVYVLCVCLLTWNGIFTVLTCSLSSSPKNIHNNNEEKKMRAPYRKKRKKYTQRMKNIVSLCLFLFFLSFFS